ncbi:MAG: hypothetical protein AAF733_13085 [Verrucomicrobiota bacterium]
MKTLSFLTFAVMALATSLLGEEAKIYLASTDTEALIAKEGQIVVVYGESDRSGKSGAGMNFVNFKGSEFVAITFISDLDQFPDGEPADVYDGKRLAVEGPISIYQDKPQIKLTSPDQVTVLEADAVFPPEGAVTEEAAPVEKKSDEVMETPEDTPDELEPNKKPPVDASEFFD